MLSIIIASFVGNFLATAIIASVVAYKFNQDLARAKQQTRREAEALMTLLAQSGNGSASSDGIVN